MNTIFSDQLCNYENKGNYSGFYCKSDGQCYSRVIVCNDVYDCGDGSDENLQVSDCGK